jgi:polysaccharide biosynthesis/export protein
MRVTRSFTMVLVLALAAAGCAQQAARLPVAPAPGGIDSVVYGPATPPRPAPAVAGRGLPLFAGPGPAVVAARPAVVAAPAPVVAAPIIAAPIAVPVAAPMVAEPVAFIPPSQGPYTLDSGDRLRVVVFGQDGLTNAYIVDAGGRIDMPLIGSVPARGCTTEELAARIADRLRQGFIREPHVAVEIEAYRPFFILGEVTAPGQYPYVANMTVETAVAIAGGFGPRGFRREVTLSRNVNGQPVRFEVPVTYPIRPGDTVIVQERWF